MTATSRYTMDFGRVGQNGASRLKVTVHDASTGTSAEPVEVTRDTLQDAATRLTGMMEGANRADVVRALAVELDAAGEAHPQPRLPKPKSVRELLNAFPKLRPPVIHGVLRQGETMNIIAASKIGKSWLVTDLAISLATGRMWLGSFETIASDVLILDNELHGETSANRIPKVAQARAVTLDEYADHVFVENLRGQLRDVFSLRPYFDAIEPGRYGLIILDAAYRFMPAGTDENDNGAMASIYNQLDSYADRLKCSFILIHHASKGNQAGKAVTDVGAGAGSQARATDTHLILRPHEDDGVVVMEAAVRSFPPLNPLCLRWSFPVWTPDPMLDPTLLRQDNGKRPRRDKEGEDAADRVVWTVDLFVERFIDATGKTKDEILIEAEAAASASARRSSSWAPRSRRRRRSNGRRGEP